ncbi:hypothetical protein ATANTOWER_028451 [Ataeniobius toweri]|uniref:Uncharacterized protein n=1 Tax=Ataeniobius toweri TaxID=208326 RepID=A0ABU7BIG2_9TELE|nr:hypothetical protein [Ataeniobius toweri]
MNQDSSLLLPHWIKPAGSLLIPSFCGSPSVNPVHPPSSIAPTTETLGPSIILAHQYSQSPVPRVINLLVSPPPSGGSLLQISKTELSFKNIGPEFPLAHRSVYFTVGIPVPVSCTFQLPVNKLLTVKLCLLNCFLHVGQICSKQYDRTLWPTRPSRSIQENSFRTTSSNHNS